MVARVLVSSTERPPITSLGPTSQKPEAYGADILMITANGIVGVQRKEVKDFVASVGDGRLGKEIIQLQACDVAVIVIEGEWHWTLDGKWFNNYAAFSRDQYESLLMSLQAEGVWVRSSIDAQDTVRVVRGIEKWAKKPEHISLMRRPKPKGKWGNIGHRGYSLHLLQSFDGISVGMAQAILDHFGYVPMAWMVTEQQLMEVPGIGKGRAKKLIEAMGKMEEVEESREAYP